MSSGRGSQPNAPLTAQATGDQGTLVPANSQSENSHFPSENGCPKPHSDELEEFARRGRNAQRAVTSIVDRIARARAMDPTADERAGMEWWNSLTETERVNWLKISGGVSSDGTVADAWAFYKAIRPRGRT